MKTTLTHGFFAFVLLFVRFNQFREDFLTRRTQRLAQRNAEADLLCGLCALSGCMAFWLRLFRVATVVLLIGFLAPPAINAEGKPGTAIGQRVELRPQLVRSNGVYGVEYWSGKQLVGSAPPKAPAGIELRLPGEPFKPVEFREKKGRGNKLELGPVSIGSLTLCLRIEHINPSLVRRTLTVTAGKPQQFATSFAFFPAPEGGSFATFTGAETTRKVYDTLGGGPEYPETAGQTFPMASFRQDGRVFGVVADSPALWENRCLMLVDPTERKLAVMNGDGRDSYELIIKYDAKDKYKYQMDGWQSLAAGETKSYVTWLFAEKAESQYDVQLAAHLALANAKGWNHSALEAILRNTSYLLCRRNLMRDEGRYLFISGIGYGWKQR